MTNDELNKQGDRTEPGERIDNRLYLTFAILLLVVDYVLVWLAGESWFEYWTTINSALRVLIPALFIILVNLKFGAPMDRFGLGKNDWRGDTRFLLKIGIPAALLLVCGFLGFVWISKAVDFGTKFFVKREFTYDFARSFVVGSVIWAPFMEELLYRGILFSSLKKFLGGPKAIFISAVAFMLLHVIYFLAGNMHFSGLEFASWFAGGVVLAYAMQKRNSLPLCMLMHALGNLTIVSLEFAGAWLEV